MARTANRNRWARGSSSRWAAATWPPVGGAPAQNGGFDAWVAERNRIEDQSISARYVSREVVGYQQLDIHGDWQSDPTYGDVWFPRNVDADWAPYRDGQWVNIAPWGLTWVDAAPWGFAPFHYGRWARVGPRWAWVPGRTTTRPVYSPALVGFVGGGANATLQIGDGRSGVGWFPLAPGEAWRPGYRASPRYIDQVNRMAAYRNRQAEPRNEFYANQRMPGAVTVLPADRFGRGPFGRRDLVRVPDDRFARVPVAPAPGVPVQGFGSGFGRPAAVLPPPTCRCCATAGAAIRTGAAGPPDAAGAAARVAGSTLPAAAATTANGMAAPAGVAPATAAATGVAAARRPGPAMATPAAGTTEP